MTETPARIWIKRALFAALVLAVIVMHLLPLRGGLGPWIGPNWIMMLAFAWCVRRPDFVPPVMLAILFLLSDLLLQRPPGLWSALVLLACENLKTNARVIRDATFASEYISVATMIVLASLGYRLILAIFLVDLPPLGLELIQILMTLIFYPLIALLTHTVLGVRKPTPGEFDSQGQRI